MQARGFIRKTPAALFLQGYRFLLFAMLFLGTPGQNVRALTIVRDFIGGNPGSSDSGTGHLEEVFNAAADVWEAIILDEHILTLHYGWAATGGGEHQLNAQGGTPNRETEGTILFNNDDVAGHHHWYLDPTPRTNEEFPNFTQISQEMGGGAVNVTRVFTGGTGDAASEDLFTAALHEIGHALGLSLANTSFMAAAQDGRINITAPRRFAGTAVPLTTNLFGVTSHIDYVADRVLMAGTGFGERVLPSTLDILAVAELSQFEQLNFNLSPKQAVRDERNQEVSIEWLPLLPGFVLEGNDDFRQEHWLPVNEPPETRNGLSTVTLGRTAKQKFFRLRRPAEIGLTVSTGNNAVDVNPAARAYRWLRGRRLNSQGPPPIPPETQSIGNGFIRSIMVRGMS
jgi:hypothetical protein